MNQPIQFAHIPKMRDIDTVEIDGATYTGAELRAALAQSEPAVVAESAEQRAVPAGFVTLPAVVTEDMHVAAAKVLLRAPGLDGLPQRMLDAMLSAAPAAQQASLVGLTPDEHRQIWIDVKGTLGGYGPPMEAAVRTFCQKNNLQLRDGGE